MDFSASTLWWVAAGLLVAAEMLTSTFYLLMLAVGILGSVMSSTGVIAIFIPVALRIAQSTGMAASRLMMPMSVAATIPTTT